MRILLFFLLSWAMASGNAFAQRYSLYSDDTLRMESRYLQGGIDVRLHLPETQPFAAGGTQYPITIIFDSQHDRTYPLLISSMDLLTSETQIPESIIVGIPFTFQNRRYLTSMQTLEQDSLGGIQRMELFLFDELIPLLQERYQANDFISLIGHSRTGFLVNYLSYTRPDRINIALSLSGFFNDEPLSLEGFHAFLTDGQQFPEKFSYYYTAGSTREESTYLVQFNKLDSLIQQSGTAAHVKAQFYETPNANHMTNYWVSAPPLLIDAFAPYNEILDSWFHDPEKTRDLKAPIEEFRKDLEKAGSSIGLALNPSLTHIYSLASQYANSKEDYRTAIQFFQLALEYYPEYLDFYVDIIEWYKTLEDTENLKTYKEIFRAKALNSTTLSREEKEDILAYLDEQ